MSYKFKEMEVYDVVREGSIDMQIKHCSGKRAINKNNPNRFTDYANFSVSASEELGPEFERFMIEMARSWRNIKHGNVLVYNSRLCEFEGVALREVIEQYKLKPKEL
jgi:hypothetical protein